MHTEKKLLTKIKLLIFFYPILTSHRQTDPPLLPNANGDPSGEKPQS